MIIAEIITIGDEILYGQIVDTNSSWISRELTSEGIEVVRHSSVTDREPEIMTLLKEAEQRANLIFMTGGLGPTRDDITKSTLCEYFGCGLKTDDDSLKMIMDIFSSRGLNVSEINRKQAEIPELCSAIPNRAGTAPGMWFEINGRIYISMPGVPHEMKIMLKEQVMPKLKSLDDRIVIEHRHIQTQGIGESFLAAKIEEWEDKLPPHLKLAYLPSVGTVKLRVTGRGTDKKQIAGELEEQIQKLRPLIEEFIIGEGDDTIESVCTDMLKKKGLTVATAESCTAGCIAQKLTTLPGSSEWFKGSLVAYSKEVKTEILGVESKLIATHGVYSLQVAEAMALRAKKLMNADFALASTGVAGPDPDEGTPPGTVYIALAGPKGVISKKLQLGSSRDHVIIEASLHALHLLQKHLI